MYRCLVIFWTNSLVVCPHTIIVYIGIYVISYDDCYQMVYYRYLGHFVRWLFPAPVIHIGLWNCCEACATKLAAIIWNKRKLLILIQLFNSMPPEMDAQGPICSFWLSFWYLQTVFNAIIKRGILTSKICLKWGIVVTVKRININTK